MAAYRRVTVPQFLVAVSQLGLAWGVILLCAAESRVDCLSNVLRFAGSGPPNSWEDYLFRGYPIPWTEHAQTGEYLPDRTRVANEPEFRGANPVVPLASLVLALGLPPVVAIQVRQSWGRCRTEVSRAWRGLLVLVVGSAAGLVVAQLDAVTAGCGRWDASAVLYEHPLGRGCEIIRGALRFTIGFTTGGETTTSLPGRNRMIGRPRLNIALPGVWAVFFLAA